MKEHIIRTEVLSLKECRAYVKENSERLGRTNFWKVVNPLKVWKRAHKSRARGKVIVALSIPVGATVFMQTDVNYNAEDTRKMRASEAFVEKQFYVGWPYLEEHSGAISTYNLDRYEEVQASESCRASHFKYETGKIVTPEADFSTRSRQCDSGIHFFVNLRDALAY